MSKVLIDRELLERAVYALQGAYERDMLTTHDLQAVLDAPSGTPVMPVKAYYHEAPNEYGGFNKSVGLEVRKTFSDAPLVLESDALVQIACLEGEIARRDAKYQREVYGLNNEGDPIGGDPAGGYANDNMRLRAELAAIKAQEPVMWRYKERADDQRSAWLYVKKRMHIPSGHKFEALYAAPVSEAKAQGVVMPERQDDQYGDQDAIGWNACLDEVARLNAATVQQPKCKTCDDNGRIGGPSFYAPDEGGEPCPDCSAPVQQVSVPDGWRLVKVGIEGIQFGNAWFSHEGITGYTADQLNSGNCRITGRAYMDWLAAAPAAPAADAWIPVSERLPGDQGHDSEEVLCFLNGHCSLLDNECRQGGGWGIRLGYYDADIGTFRVFGRPESHVTHWMPLPASPIKIEANRHDQ